MKGLRTLQAVEGSIWCIQPDKLREIGAVVANRVRGGAKLTAAEVAAIQRPKVTTNRSGAVAVLPLHGVVAQRMDMMTAFSGGTSTEAFAKEFRALVKDDNVSAIVIDIDSPGGSVAGVPELAREIRAARGSKPIVAVANSLMASAAYWIGSAADEVVATEMSFVGSVNAIIVRADMTEKDARDGIEYHFITGGPTDNKAEGSPHFPASEEELAALQANVDVAYNAFIQAVAEHRGISAEKVRETYGEGRAFIGSRAVDAGLADRIATLDEVIADLQGRQNGRRRMSADTEQPPIAASTLPHGMIAEFSGGSITMTGNSADTASIYTTAELLAAHNAATGFAIPLTVAGRAAPDDAHNPPASETAPAAEESTMADNATAATAHGAAPDVLTAERTRIAELRALAKDFPAVTEEKLTAWIDGGTSYADAGREAMRLTSAAAKPATTSGATTPVVTVRDRAENDPRRGFASHRDFLMAAMSNAGYRDRSQVEDARLRPLAVFDKEDRVAAGDLAFVLPEAFTPPGLMAAAGSDEQGGYADQYGGFAVPTSVLPGMLEVGAEADPTAGRTQPIPMASPNVEINARVDKDHSTSVSGGLTVTRRPETVDASSSRTKMEQVGLKATGLFGLAYATEEILTDSPISFAAIIASGFRSQIAFHMLNEKIRGNGGNEYLGVLNSPAKIEVAKESGQAADTINATNLIKMRQHSWGYGQAIWIANNETYTQLIQAAIVKEGSVGGGLILVYQSSLQGDRPDMLLGRPIFYSEHASALGDVGDIMLVNWSQYLEGLYQPLQSAESVHVRFVQHERAFKFWLRNAGAPWWRSALTPHKGASGFKLSPIVTLAARA